VHKQIWEPHALFSAIEPADSGSLSLLGRNDLFYFCTAIEPQPSGYFKTLHFRDTAQATRTESSPLGRAQGVGASGPSLKFSWDISPRLLGPNARRVWTLTFDFKVGDAVPFELADSRLPLEFSRDAGEVRRNAWWRVDTSRGPIAFDTATALELAFGPSHRMANMLLSPFSPIALHHWRTEDAEHLWVRSPNAGTKPLNQSEVVCASFWLGNPEHLRALEDTRSCLANIRGLRLPCEIQTVACDAAGIHVNDVLLVQVFGTSRASLPVNWDKLCVIENAETLRGHAFERVKKADADWSTRAAIRSRRLSPQEVRRQLPAWLARLS
jgi:hypothetical protein